MLLYRWVLFVSIICFGLNDNYTFAKDNAVPIIKIALNEIPGVLAKDRTDLPYNEVFSALSSNSSFSIQFRFDAAHRASANFNYKETDCLFPASLSSSRYSAKDKTNSEPINIAKAYFIAKQVVETSLMINDKTKKFIIGYKRGNSFGNRLDLLNHHTLIPLSSIDQAAQLLNRERIDVILAYMPDSMSILQNDDNAALQYSERSFFHSQGDRILCHLNPQNQKFISEVNTTILSLKESGKLKKLLGPAFLK